nr:hypothetical protein [Tanacetum cinerariifolium]
MKDKARSNLNNEENNFMLDTSYGEETIEELTVVVMLMARIQPADGNVETVPSYDAKVVSKNQDLLITISELKNKLKTVDKGKNVNTKFDKSESSRTLLCVTPLPKNIAIKAKKVSNFKVSADRSKPVTLHPTPTNEQGVESSNSVRRHKSKDTKSKNRVLKNTNTKSLTAHDVFLLSHEKCVARYALSRNSSVTRALFTTLITAKSKNLRATSVVAKSRLSVAKTPTATNKVSSVLLSPDSSQSRTFSN